MTSELCPSKHSENEALINALEDDSSILKKVYQSSSADETDDANRLFLSFQEIKHFQCCICNFVPYECIEIGCHNGHLICSWCYLEYLNHNTSFKCPIDKVVCPLEENRSNYTIQRLIKSQTVRCIYHQLGCKETFVLGKDNRNLLEHYRKTEKSCPYALQKCLGCQQEFPFSLIRNHIQKCDGRYVKCLSCPGIFAYRDWETNHKTTLIKIKLTTAVDGVVNVSMTEINACINNTICLNHLDCLVPVHQFSAEEKATTVINDVSQINHNKTTCPYELMVCPLNPNGCQPFFRQDFMLHLETTSHQKEMYSLYRNLLISKSDHFPGNKSSVSATSFRAHHHPIRFHVNQMLLCQDTNFIYYVSIVKAINHHKQQIRIHYEGWSSDWDEWINVDSRRIITFNYGKGVLEKVLGFMTIPPNMGPLQCSANNCHYMFHDASTEIECKTAYTYPRHVYDKLTPSQQRQLTIWNNRFMVANAKGMPFVFNKTIHDQILAIKYVLCLWLKPGPGHPLISIHIAKSRGPTDSPEFQHVVAQCVTILGNKEDAEFILDDCEEKPIIVEQPLILNR